MRKPCAAVYFIWFVMGLLTKINPQSDFELYHDPLNSDFLVDTALERSFIYGNDNGTEVNLYWGIKDINKTEASYWDASFIGYPLWDYSFNPATRTGQLFFKEFCKDLDKKEFAVNFTMKCWINDFEDYVRKTLKKSFPVSSEDKFIEYLDQWSKDEGSLGPEYLFKKYFVIEKQRVLFAKVTANTILYSTANQTMKMAEYKKWEDFLKEQKMVAPPEMINMKETSRIWPLIQTEASYKYG